MRSLCVLLLVIIGLLIHVGHACAQPQGLDSTFLAFRSHIESLSPSDSLDALLATYRLVWVEESGMIQSATAGDGRNLDEVVSEFRKKDYRFRDGSDYGLWDYQVYYIGNRYAVLIANRAVNIVVQQRYYFERER